MITDKKIGNVNQETSTPLQKKQAGAEATSNSNQGTKTAETGQGGTILASQNQNSSTATTKRTDTKDVYSSELSKEDEDIISALIAATDELTNGKTVQKNHTQPTYEDSLQTNQNVLETVRINADANQIIDTTEKIIENLSNKYNLNLHIDNLSEDDTELLQKLYFIDSMPDVANNMNEYFTSLGTIDNIYDGMKTLFNWQKDGALTKEDVEKFAQNEGFKKEALVNSLKNKGKLVVDDADSDTAISKETLATMSQETMASLGSFSDMLNYAQEFLDIPEDEAVNLIKEPLKNCIIKEMTLQFGECPDNLAGQTEVVKGDDGKYYISSPGSFNNLSIDEFLFGDNLHSATLGSYAVMNEMSDVLSKNAKFENGQDISFEKLYGIFRGTEYNEENIQQLNSVQPLYDKVTEITTETLKIQKDLDGASPIETYRYFEKTAEERNDGSTAADLYNEYFSNVFTYANSMEESPFEGIGDYSGLTVNSLEVNDEGELTETFKLKDPAYLEFLDTTIFTYNEETGLVTKKTNLFYKDDSGNIVENPDMSGSTISEESVLFYNLNKAVNDKNVYFNSKKDEFNRLLTPEEETPQDIFSVIPVEYSKIYSDSAGVNVLEAKLNSYKDDMDSYASNISKALTIGGFALSWVPGMQAAGYAALIGACSDNFIDGANLISCSSDDKGEKGLEIASRTGKEFLGMLAGFGINAVSARVGAEAAASYIFNAGENAINATAKTIATATEYLTDFAASIGWDIANYAIENGGLPNESELGSLLLQNALFNSSDLRAGIALYKATADPSAEIKLHGNRTLQYGEDGCIILKQYMNDESDYIDKASYISSDDKVRIFDSEQLGDNTKVDITKNGYIVKSYDDSDEIIKTVMDIDGKITTINVDEFAQKNIENYRAEIESLKSSNDDLPKHILSDEEIIQASKICTELGADYAKYLYKAEQQILDIFGNEPNIVTTRSKGIESAFAKLVSKVQKGYVDLNDIDSCKIAIADAFGTRVQARPLTSEENQAIVEKYLKKNKVDCDYEDFKRYYTTDEASEYVKKQLDEARMYEIKCALKEAEMEPVAKAISKAIRNKKVAITELNNYGDDGSTYLTPRLIEMIADANYKATKQSLDIITRKEEGYSAPWVASKTKEGDFEINIDKYNISTKNSEKNSGYASTHLNNTFKFDKKGTIGLGEIQLRSMLVNKYSDVEHIPYDIKKGKIKGDNPKYRQIYDVMTTMDENSSKLYNDYTKKVYTTLRNWELGYKEFELPKLEGIFKDEKGNILDVSCLTYENLIANFSH